jgi:2-dehydro-3-deoxyphosphogluconate aldolase/(4S)-4-hydroxy-2-oxoglutarate aldolase
VKLFPAEPLGGARLIAALAAPFPEARFVPTGGLGAHNAAEYLRLPPVLAIGGSWMVAPNLLEAEDWDAVTRLTADAIGLAVAA